MTLDDAIFTLAVRNTTQHLSKQAHQCHTWKDLCLLLLNEFSKDTGPIAAIPALLTACEEALRCATGLSATVSDTERRRDSVIANLKAAIDKATA